MGKNKTESKIKTSKAWYDKKWHEPLDSVDQFSLIYSTGNTLRHEWLTILLGGYAILYVLFRILIPVEPPIPAAPGANLEELPVVEGTLDDVSYNVADARLDGEKATVELIIDDPEGVSSFLKPFHDAILTLNPEASDAEVIVYPDVTEQDAGRPSYSYEDGELIAYEY